MKNQSRELLWYEWSTKDEDGNVIEGKMHKFRGGKLDFSYDSRAKQLSVGTAPVKITTYETESNEKDIDYWLEDNKVEFELSKVSGVGITVTFPDKNKEKVKKALAETDFTYEIV